MKRRSFFSSSELSLYLSSVVVSSLLFLNCFSSICKRTNDFIYAFLILR